MPVISNIDVIVSAIRSSLTAARRTEGKTRRPATSAKKTSLEQRIAARVASIPPSDPEREAKALRAFVEAVLLQELGEQLTNDIGFRQLVDKVAEQIENSETLQKALQLAMHHLFDGKR
ncbi:hypothetical protein [Chitinimonas lacunae]|uniref:Uncharacterized protein n=1 Tax=Chitinimonas lacunae TaxID=1963018 RepID=A0ABV8MYS0_9NEIS